MTLTSSILCAATALALTVSSLAQQPVLLAALPPAVATTVLSEGSSPTDTTASESSTSTVVVAAPAPAEPRALTARWLDLKNFSHAERYRNAYSKGLLHLFEDGQQRSIVEGRIKLDAQDRYTIAFRATSGHYFNWAYADYAGEGFSQRIKALTAVVASYTPSELQERTIAKAVDPDGVHVVRGIQSNGWQFYLRELSLSASPVKPVTLEFGSFGIERGFSTEITTFDDDGYIVGERLRIRDPKHLFFDQIGYTNAFFGDVGTPSLFDRSASFTQFNYRQVFANKQLNPHVGFSGEYTWQLGTETLREAAVVSSPAMKVADSVRLEAYERVNTVNL